MYSPRHGKVMRTFTDFYSQKTNVGQGVSSKNIITFSPNKTSRGFAARTLPFFQEPQGNSSYTMTEELSSNVD